MQDRRAVRWLTWVVGVAFVGLGVAEVSTRLFSSEPTDVEAVAFWFISLCGGGALILAGRFVVPRPSGWSITMVATGCILGTLATAWTLVLPVLAVTLLVMTVVEQAQPSIRD